MNLTKRIALVSASVALGLAAPAALAAQSSYTTQAATSVSKVKVTKTDYFYNSKGKKITYTYQGWTSKKVYKNTTYNVSKTVTIDGEDYYYIGNDAYIKASVCKPVKTTTSSSSKKSTKKSSSSSSSKKSSATSSSSKKKSTTKKSTVSSKSYVVLANNASVYNSKGKATTTVLIKGHKYRYYATTKISGKTYYAINSKQTRFVRDSDVKNLVIVNN